MGKDEYVNITKKEHILIIFLLSVIMFSLGNLFYMNIVNTRNNMKQINNSIVELKKIQELMEKEYGKNGEKLEQEYKEFEEEINKINEEIEKDIRDIERNLKEY